MDTAVAKAITLGTVALPTMFFVIGVFILATKALHAAFPAESDKDDN